MLWHPKRRIEQAYQRSLIAMFKSALTAFNGIDTLKQFKTMLEQWSNSETFDKFAESVSRKMITSLFDDVGKDWRSAARYNSQGRRIYELLMKDLSGERGRRVDNLVHQNAELIKSLPVDIADDVAQYIFREMIKGRRPENIERDIIKMFPDRAKARAKLIARTECAKTQTALVQGDAEEIGANWYIWRSTKDQRVRVSHHKMDGILCSWRDPPNPEALFPSEQKPYGSYHPGCTFNCRCYPDPIVTKYQLTKNTYKVYQYGQLQTLNKSAVLKLISL